ncbi:type II toxin-antitoxin system Phd/YefM family antitoxin [Companilactobacillus sp. HBUAS59699]|uniref:type II toxin-antitoxin system Phd/YefM family antitoxin n=1 Tax=Companilactobacillus sp. HBUAS59699 TaxID=3109358 RepID=UPI002FF04F25
MGSVLRLLLPSWIYLIISSEKTGLYVFSRDTPAGVVISVDDYENLVKENDRLKEEVFELNAAKRLKNPGISLSYYEVRGEIANKTPHLDPNDGWE